jgi:SAM-dependent methyltransferase
MLRHAVPTRALTIQTLTKGSSLTDQPASHFESLTACDPLALTTVEAALVELLEAVRTDRLPAQAQRQLHCFYDRFQRWRSHFLHHFAPFVCLADQVFQIAAARPRLLDLGCGVATQAHMLAIRGATMTGLDNNRERVAAGRAMTEWFTERARMSPLNVSLHCEDAFAWLDQQPAGCFDGCYAQFALAYMRPHQSILERIDRVVRPGGRILIREFNAGSLYNRLVARVDWLSAVDYRRIAERFGWTCQQLDYCWILPRQIICCEPARHWLGPLETRLMRRPALGAATAAAMTLVFEKSGR